jgi:hypothetical protein
MLAHVTLAEQWREIEAGLPPDWTTAQANLTVSQDERVDQAALLLTPLAPGRTGGSFRLQIRREMPADRVLGRLDAEGIRGRLDLVAVEERREAPAQARPERARPLAEQWGELVGRLPQDWSDVYAEVELESSDFLQRGALLLAPVNPARNDGPTTLRFRVARRSGYGAAEPMTRRCLERLDREQITGRVRILRTLSATSHVSTQGPVWRVGGRAV